MPGDLCFHQILTLYGILAGMMVGMVVLYERIMQRQFTIMPRKFENFFVDEMNQKDEEIRI